MAHLAHAEVIQFRPGPLKADALNAAFSALYALVQEAGRLALTPDPVVRSCEVRLAQMEERLVALEGLSRLHERQRNEREWAPLSHLGAVLTRLQGLQDQMAEAVARLEAAHEDSRTLHEQLMRQIGTLKQQPDSATQEAFDALKASHDELKSKELMLLAQTIALRAEVTIVRDLAMGHDRQANRLEYAPLSYVAALLSRLQALEEKR